MWPMKLLDLMRLRSRRLAGNHVADAVEGYPVVSSEPMRRGPLPTTIYLDGVRFTELLSILDYAEDELGNYMLLRTDAVQRGTTFRRRIEVDLGWLIVTTKESLIIGPSIDVEKV